MRTGGESGGGTERNLRKAIGKCTIRVWVGMDGGVYLGNDNTIWNQEGERMGNMVGKSMAID